MSDTRTRTAAQYEILQHERFLQNINLFPSQRAEADRLLKVARQSIRNGVHVDMLVAPPQFGKTGMMLAFIENLVKHDVTDLENIFVCTTHSSKNWLAQTKERMPRSIRDRVYHRNGMFDMAEEINNQRGVRHGPVVVIVDESHIASQQRMTMDEVFKILRVDDPNSNIYLLEVTATPDGLIEDMHKSGVGTIVRARVNNDYNSFQRMLSENRLRETFPLFIRDEEKRLDQEASLVQFRRMVDIIADEFPERPRWHLVRLPTFMYGRENRGTIRELTSAACVGIDTRFYDMEGESDADPRKTLCVNDMFLNKPPTRHTVIYVKDMLRCSDTLNLTDVGVMIDRDTNLTSVAAQSFAGRCNGYTEHEVVCFTNVNEIRKYMRAYNNGFDYHSNAWRSVTLKSNGAGKIRSVPTANRVLWSEDNANEENPENLDVYYIVGSRDEIQRRYEEQYRPIAGTRIHPIRWDFYISPKKITHIDGKPMYLCNGPRGKPQVWSVSDVMKDCRWGLDNTKKNNRRIMIAYDNPLTDNLEDYKVLVFTHRVIPQWTRFTQR